MISVLTQQRFDIVESYDAVVRQRGASQPPEDGDEAKKHALNRVNRVVPKDRSSRSQSHDKLDKMPRLDPDDDLFGDALDAEQRPLYPVQSDGGSHVPTKREEVQHVATSPKVPLQRAQGSRRSVQQKGSRLLTTASSSKHPGILVEEMEKHMLNEEVARIESM